MPLPHVLAAVIALLTLGASAASAADRNPNFVFVYSDDHRWDAIGVVQYEQDKQARFPWFKSPQYGPTGSRGACDSATPS